MQNKGYGTTLHIFKLLLGHIEIYWSIVWPQACIQSSAQSCKGSLFLFIWDADSHQWQLKVTVLQNYVSSSSNSSWYSKSSRIMYLASAVNWGELTSSSFVGPLFNFSYLRIETNSVTPCHHEKVTSWYHAQWVFSYLWMEGVVYMLFTRQPKVLKWITIGLQQYQVKFSIWRSSLGIKFFGRLQKKMQSKSEVNHTTSS